MVKRFAGLLPETVKKVWLTLEFLFVISTVLVVNGCERTQQAPPSLPPPEVLVTEVIQQAEFELDQGNSIEGSPWLCRGLMSIERQIVAKENQLSLGYGENAGGEEYLPGRQGES